MASDVRSSSMEDHSEDMEPNSSSSPYPSSSDDMPTSTWDNTKSQMRLSAPFIRGQGCDEMHNRSLRGYYESVSVGVVSRCDMPSNKDNDG